MTGSTTGGRLASRGIGIGIGVAAGAAGLNRGVKRELEDAGMGGMGSEDLAGAGGDMAGRSMSEQQKLERRVSLCIPFVSFGAGLASWKP